MAGAQQLMNNYALYTAPGQTATNKAMLLNAAMSQAKAVAKQYAAANSAGGVGSLTFVPPKPGRPAVFELERFRLATGAAVYVDSKAIPYRDVEVLEWRRRVANCERWYAADDWDATGTADAVAAEGVTHVVVPAGVTVRSRRVRMEYEDAAHRVYRIE